MAQVAQSLKLEYLRSLIRGVEKSEHGENFPFSLLQAQGAVDSGIPRGGLVEIDGPGKTSVVLRFLAENSRPRVAWIEESLTIYPPAFLQRNVSLDRVLFIEAGGDLFWAASQALRSGLFEVVVLSFRRFLNDHVLRRLQLETEKAHAAFFLLPESGGGGGGRTGGSISPSASWTLALRLNTKNLNARNEITQLDASWKEAT